jgi:hypothetical protein
VVGGGGVGVGGKRVVKVWDNFGVQLGPGYAHRPLRSLHGLHMIEMTLSARIQVAGITSQTRTCIFRRRQGGQLAMDPL